MNNSKKIQLEKYTLDKSQMIGQGSFGKVYKGINTETSEEICIKVFFKNEKFGGYILETLNDQELEITRRMINKENENLVKIIEIYDEINQDKAYLIMELCDHSLKQYVQNTKKLSSSEIYDFIKQVTNGYHRLEEEHVIHRDLKPENILVKLIPGRVIYKICDFGLGKLLDQAKKETRTKEKGTPYYWAPEVMGNNFTKFYSSKCDIYSFGIIIFELLIGINTFKSSVNREKLKTQNFEDLFANELLLVQDLGLKKLLSSMIIYDCQKRIGWKELKTIVDLNTIDKYQGILGTISKNLFSGYYAQDEQKRITVKVFERVDENQNKLSFYFQHPQIDSNNVVKIEEIINNSAFPFVYVIFENCGTSLQSLIGKIKFSSNDILQFIEQIVNGYFALQIMKRQMYSITLDNILISLNNNDKTYKITNYEFFINYKAQSTARVSELAWIIYQLILNDNLEFYEFQQNMKSKEKIDALLQSLDIQVKNIVLLLMKTEKDIQVNWESLKKQISNMKNPVKFTGQMNFESQSVNVPFQFIPLTNKFSAPHEQAQPTQFGNFHKFPTNKVPQSTQQNYNFQQQYPQQYQHQKTFSATNIQINNPHVNFNPQAQSQVINNNFTISKPLNFQPSQQQQTQGSSQGFQNTPQFSQQQPNIKFQTNQFQNNKGQFIPFQQAQNPFAAQKK